MRGSGAGTRRRSPGFAPDERDGLSEAAKAHNSDACAPMPLCTSPEVVSPACSVGAKRQRRLASAVARRSYRARCGPPPPQGRSSFVPARTTRRQPGGSPIPRSLPRRCRTAARNVVPNAHSSSGSRSGQRRTGKQLVANGLHSRRNRVDNMPGDPLLSVGCRVAHRDAPYNYSTSRTIVAGPSFTSETSIFAPNTPVST